MKKLLSLLLALSTCFAFVACEDEEPSNPSANPPANPPAHTHEYASEWSKDDTHHWYACTGTDCTEVKDKAEHSWNNGVVDGDTKTFTCTTCGKTKSEAVQTDYDVTGEEWATALSFPYDNYKIYSDGGTLIQTTEVYGATVRMIATSNGQVMVNQLATQVGDNYYMYGVEEYKVNKIEIAESIYESNRTMAMATTFLFDDFTYDTASKTYKANSVSDAHTTYTNVEMKFENGKLASMSMSYAMGGAPINANITVTYGDVQEIKVPNISITEEQWNATKAKFNDHSVPKTFIQTQGERIFTLQTDGVTLYTHIFDEAYGIDEYKIYTKDGDEYFTYEKNGNGAWTVTEYSQTAYEQSYKTELDIIKNNAMLASYQYIVETDGVYTYEPYGSGSRRYTYYFIDGELRYLESRIVGEFEIAVNYDVPVIEIPQNATPAD